MYMYNTAIMHGQNTVLALSHLPFDQTGLSCRSFVFLHDTNIGPLVILVNFHLKTVNVQRHLLLYQLLSVSCHTILGLQGLVLVKCRCDKLGYRNIMRVSAMAYVGYFFQVLHNIRFFKVSNFPEFNLYIYIYI
jgi:hypothetical protein